MDGVHLYDAVVIGVSTGGFQALEKILPRLHSEIPAPVFIVQHVSPDSNNYMTEHFSRRCRVRVKEAEDKETPAHGTIYFAPPDYHLMVEYCRTLALSADERVNFSRPSVDVLFETAAEAYGEKLIGIVLTGANSDGAAGLVKIKKMGGLTIVQSPETAEASAMPRAALAAVKVDHILPLEEIADFINRLFVDGAA